MKNIQLTLISLLGLVLIGCSGSDTYRGKWKGLNAKGDKLEIVFDANKFTIGNDTLHHSMEYKQNSINIENGVETYGITLDNGIVYQINFPIEDNESIGVIKDETGEVVCTISRNGYVKYEDIFKLK